MYYNYWNLIKPPFDNVPDPSMYVDCHASMENAIAETLFAIEEGRDSLAVIVGDVGLGKTLSLRMIIDSLEQEKYKIALITNPGISFCQLLKEIIGQLTGVRCDVGRKGDLLETFNRLLFDTIDEGRRVLIFIDEANAISPATLESLRLLTNMQDDLINLFTVVLAGQMELARRLEHPKRKNLFQRIGTYNRIDKIHSENLVKNYVETRLKLAGGTTKIFTDDAFIQLWEHSEHGVPRLINKISKLCLKAGETNEFSEITGDVVRQIGERFCKLTGPAIQRRRPRKRFEKEVVQDQYQEMEPAHTPGEVLVGYERDNRVSYIEQLRPVELKESVEKSSLTMTEDFGRDTKTDMIANDVVSEESSDPAQEASRSVEQRQCDDEVRPVIEKEGCGEVEIGTIKVRVNVPAQLIKRAQSLTRESRIKVAGAVAAQTLQQHPQLVSSQQSDPVHVWGEIREFVLNMLGKEKKVSVM
ncbi:MAG: AAA family ATPase [Deltaproteobacteria bacterium]|nr:AAA family ATPase [Deltaproteobacteria bacterium]